MDKRKVFNSLIREKTKEQMEEMFGSRKAQLRSVLGAILVGFAKLVIFGKSTAMNYFIELAISSLLVGGLWYISYWIFSRFRAPYLVGQGLVTDNKEIKLFVEHGNTVYEKTDGTDLIPCLVLDLVNFEGKKIVELEAFLTTVLQWTDEHPDRSICNSQSGTRRLLWSGEKEKIDLTPLFPETKLKIASLNCSSKEFRFLTLDKMNEQSLQKSAIYRFGVLFKGKLEGSDTEYKFFKYEAEFVCSPNDCIIDYLPAASAFPNFPQSLKSKLVATA
jgi:hypothetical protein